jgi:hypothetical protein
MNSLTLQIKIRVAFQAKIIQWRITIFIYQFPTNKRIISINKTYLAYPRLSMSMRTKTQSIIFLISTSIIEVDNTKKAKENNPFMKHIQA